MPPATVRQRFEKSIPFASGWLASALNRVFTPTMMVNGRVRRVFTKPAMSRGLAIRSWQAPSRAIRTAQAVSAKMW